ncbi:hypothetical protein CAOG_00417 [Capsaspora owczarzaki ATCC 30864]|uniref:Uncharacterized protein n=1 Tax=Capsaspora owczarzaki (strain ATCC 30864) TaxID=595528 RepID=A0A0D2WIH2_CAPO3|nr:hypothetical protein CAOG_00417 [Capsaspora owczarzaki ATCC 30864]KJE88838.1 hypothetical protein CAOG_000417 [Capsaspora owczarzaki ATCC 30864]|eukprot:XP_004365288.1 hypothetical protein CAOG_00417 [Capsaspora owczarzaki ATCC 30864]
MATVEEVAELRAEVARLAQTVESQQAAIADLTQTVAKLTAAGATTAQRSTLGGASPAAAAARRTPATAAAAATTTGTPSRSLSASAATASPARSAASSTTTAPAAGARRTTATATAAPGSPAARGRVPLTNGSAAKAPAASSAAAVPGPEPHHYFIQGRRIVVHPPTGYVKPTEPASAPEVGLTLSHVHGFRGRDTFNNLFLVDEGRTAIWNTAAVVVLQDVETGRQRHLLGHTDDITCLAVDATRKFAVTGQVCSKGKGEKAYLILWDLTTGTAVGHLGGKNIGGHDQSVACAAFSADGSHILSIGNDTEHTAIVWNAATRAQVYTAPGGQDKVVAVGAVPNTSTNWISVGTHHVSFWGAVDDKPFARKKGIFGKHGDQQTIVSVAYNESGSRAVTGTAKTGEILLWNVATASVLASASSGNVGEAGNSILGLRAVPGHPGSFISTDKLKNAQVWQLAENDTLTAGASSPIGIEARAIDVLGSRLVVGGVDHTAKLFQLAADGLTVQGAGVVLTSAHSAEVWALAHHPSKTQFATAADDKKLTIFDAVTHAQLQTTALPGAARSVSYNSDGTFIAVGLNDGRFVVLQGDTLEVVGGRKDRKEEIADIRFSSTVPSILAVASHDNFIDVYHVAAGAIERKAICKGHSSFITHIDWSADGRFLRSTSGDYELLFWEALTGKQVTASVDVRDLTWASQTCVLGWDVAGIWPPDSDGTDVNAVSASPDNTLLASGSDDGFVRLFRIPVLEPGRNIMAPAKEYGARHSAHVTNVRFSRDGKSLVSTGGNDCTIMLWTVA